MVGIQQRVGGLPSVRRLPTYLRLLRQFQDSGRDIVSSNRIAEMLKIEPIQVRKDLAITGTIGKPKIGYYVPTVIKAIEDFLGWNNTNEAFLVGAGSLGSALLRYEGFKQHGLSIVAAFDVDEAKIGTEIGETSVLHLDKLPDLAQRMHIQTGIIAVPASAAQAVADHMVSAGIDAIWNFAPATIEVPDDVVVQNEDLAAGLAVLCFRSAGARNAAGAN